MIVSTFQNSLFQADGCTYKEYQSMVQNETVSSAIISQNKQTPTGRIQLILTDGNQTVINVPDVNVEKQYLDQNGISIRFEDVPQENYFMTNILPTLLVLIGCFFLFSFLSGRSGGGNGNAMLNF